jgi:transcriptional regulator with XRE-family HTH domain
MKGRQYLQKTEHPHPHIGAWVKRVLENQKMSQAELARRIQVSPNTLINYFKQPSIQFGILWNIGVALNYDFFTELVNFYPSKIQLNGNSRLVAELDEKTTLITDLQKEIEIYKSALGIKK